MSKESVMPEDVMPEKKDFMNLAKELRSKISAVRSDYQSVLSKVEVARKSKAEAKERYNICIDKGNESGLRECLKLIRKTNEVIENLPASRSEYMNEIWPVLDHEHGVLLNAIREHRSELEAILERAKKDLERAEAEYWHIHGIQSELNSLKTLIDESGEPISEGRGI